MGRQIIGTRNHVEMDMLEVLEFRETGYVFLFAGQYLMQCAHGSLKDKRQITEFGRREVVECLGVTS
jgi:hypothetical protein